MPIVEAPKYFRRSSTVEQYQNTIPMGNFDVPYESVGRGSYSELFEVRSEVLFAADHQGIYSRRPWQAKLDYYYSKVLKTIYPDHFPSVYAGITGRVIEGMHTPGGTFRERIRYEDIANGDKEINFGLELGVVDEEQLGSLRYWAPAEIFRDFLEWANNGIPLIVDPGPGHFVQDNKTGDIKYLDLPMRTPRLNIPWDIDKISNLMKAKGFSGEKIESIVRIIGRVVRLEEMAPRMRDLMEEFGYRRPRLTKKGRDKIINSLEDLKSDEKKMVVSAVDYVRG